MPWSEVVGAIQCPGLRLTRKSDGLCLGATCPFIPLRKGIAGRMTGRGEERVFQARGTACLQSRGNGGHSVPMRVVFMD